MIQKVKRGWGSLAEVKDLMDKLHIQKPLLVCGNHLAKVFDEKALPVEKCVHFNGYKPNPDYEDCRAGVKMYIENGCDGMISLGGGSAMDTAKCIKAMMIGESDEKIMNSILPENAGIPHIAIPGTAGTGAEATQFAVVYVNNQKLSISHPSILPEGIVLDPSLLATLPEYHKKACALDALCQGIESYWARSATEDSRVHAYLSILGVLDHIRGYLAGDEKAAEGMLEASYRSGRAIQTSRTTAAHAMSYQLTKKLGYAHGHACMLTLPALWDKLIEQEDALAIMMDLAQKMRLGSEYMGSRLLAGLLIDLDMEPREMPDEELLQQLTDSVDVERLGNHPMALTTEEIKGIYRPALTRRAGPDRQVCIDLWKYYGQ